MSSSLSIKLNRLDRWNKVALKYIAVAAAAAVVVAFAAAVVAVKCQGLFFRRIYCKN